MDRSSGSREESAERLRSIPAVHRVVAALDGHPHGLAVRAAREAVAATRERVRRGQPLGDLDGEARRAAQAVVTALP